MASIRGEVHESELPRLIEFLLQDGWSVEETKGVFEKVRARKNETVFLGYQRMKSRHLSFSLDYIPIIDKYRRWVRSK